MRKGKAQEIKTVEIPVSHLKVGTLLPGTRKGTTRRVDTLAVARGCQNVHVTVGGSQMVMCFDRTGLVEVVV